MKKIMILALIAIIGGGIFVGSKLVNADTERLNNIKSDLQLMQQQGLSSNWVKEMSVRYGDDWDDLMEREYGQNWDAEIEAKYGDDWDELFDDRDDNDEIDYYDDIDDVDNDRDDIDDNDGIDDVTIDSSKITEIENKLNNILNENGYVENWDDIMDANYGDNWDDLIEKKYGEDWDDIFERELANKYGLQNRDLDD